MSKKPYFEKNFHRLIDANTNRLKEGLRVIEDISRFIIDDRKITAEIKKIRHATTQYIKDSGVLQDHLGLKERQINKDVGRKSTISEMRRKSIADIFLANAQRVKESIRVLEEFFKISDKSIALGFKRLRYKIYDIEKQAIEKISKLCDTNQ